MLRLIGRTRAILRKLPIPLETQDPMATYVIPTELTGVQVPLKMRQQTALDLRGCLEDQVILEERMAERMRLLTTMISQSLMSR